MTIRSFHKQQQKHYFYWPIKSSSIPKKKKKKKKKKHRTGRLAAPTASQPEFSLEHFQWLL